MLKLIAVCLLLCSFSHTRPATPMTPAHTTPACDGTMDATCLASCEAAYQTSMAAARTAYISTLVAAQNAWNAQETVCTSNYVNCLSSGTPSNECDDTLNACDEAVEAIFHMTCNTAAITYSAAMNAAEAAYDACVASCCHAE